MPDRRAFLQTLAGLPLVGGLFSAERAIAARGAREFFKELGVRPFINAAGTYTYMTASLMPPEVTDAYQYASRQYVLLDELHDAVGKRIASMLGCEAAMVTAGAASALTLGTAAVLTGKNPDFIRRLPNLEGMKSEVIMQKSHRFGYDHAVRNCGIRIVEVETSEELERAVNPQTAMMLFFNDANPRGAIKDEEFVALGKKHAIPTFNDCAADVPPVENLTKYIKMGFDLVTFSGGKGLRGPQSAGLLLGRTNLIEAARLNTSPNGDTIGRGMKVNKEEMLSMLVALELYLRKDHAAEFKEWERRAAVIRSAAISVPGVEAEIYVPPIANHVPHIRVKWDQQRIKLTPPEVQKELEEGEPRIMVRNDDQSLQVSVWMMRAGEEKVVAKRLRQVLRSVTPT